MTNVTLIPDHSVRALSRLTTQFKGKENIEKLLKVFTNELQTAEAALFDVLNLRALSTATAAQLDSIGEHIGSLRAGKNDVEYKAAIAKQIAINISNGTEKDIHDVVMNLTDATTVKVTDSGTAEVRVTTDGVSTGDPTIPGTIESMIAAGVGFYGVEVVFTPEDAFAFRSTDEAGADPAVGKGFSSTDAGYESVGGEFVSVSI